MRNREQAARAAEAQDFNQVGMCQMVTRTWFDAPSVGDVDRDGDGDAVDGWLSEPKSARHEEDRHPPRGVPVSWAGGTNGHGHRAISLGDGRIRSTDAGGLGRVATVDLGWVERTWGMRYLGWSETISGQVIPPAPKTPTRVREARELLRAARVIAKDAGQERRAHRISKALDVLPWK